MTCPVFNCHRRFLKGFISLYRDNHPNCEACCTDVHVEYASFVRYLLLPLIIVYVHDVLECVS